ncbi:MAG: undecaprenyl-diphosphate phosphatase [Oscillospiraceae bacterium]|jgi:undecaprenyl-diphosphatase|nr:undecaprenyl-diphosphate phosphatase [Oscillospiraceae bacterium]
MTNFSAIIQGIIQGITEFLPVSSSGHLMLSQYFLGIHENNLIFDIALHVGTLISVIIVYYKTVFRLFFAFFSCIGNLFSKQKKSNDERLLINLFISLLPLFAMFIKIPGIGKIKDFASNLIDSSNLTIVGLAFIVTSVLLFFGDLISKNYSNFKKLDKISFKDSILVGISQFFAAIFPGLSRSGSTLSVGLMCGIERQSIIDFSFLMSIPTIIAAALLKFKEIRSYSISIDRNILILGILSSAITGVLTIKLFKWLVQNDKTKIFVIYTFILGIFSIMIYLL